MLSFSQKRMRTALHYIKKKEMDVFILRSYWIGYLVYSSDYAVYHLLQTDIHCAVLAPISENSQPFNQQSVMGLWLGIYEAAQGIWRAES